MSNSSIGDFAGAYSGFQVRGGVKSGGPGDEVPQKLKLFYV